MNTTRIEELLEQLIDKQDELISRIEAMEATIEQNLSEINSGISEINRNTSSINDELNWYGDGHSFAKQLLESIAGITGPSGYNLSDIHSELSSINTTIMLKD